MPEDMNDYQSKKVKENESHKLDINCPKCDKENTIIVSSELKCKSCSEPLTKNQYGKFKKPFIGVFTAILIGGIGGHKITDYVSSERYPMSVEHSIIENCISSYDKPLRKSYISNKKDICICALSKTTKEYDYGDFKENQQSFLNIFENKANDCK